MAELKMSLFENGIDFIERSIYSYDEAKENPGEYKYALLLLGIGAELILKRILEKEHPLFLLDKFENDTKTVTSEKIIDRIKMVYRDRGRRISNDDVKNIEAIRSIRNNIIHKEVNIKDEPSVIFSQTLYSLDRMVKLFLNTTLSSTVSNWNHIVSDETIRSHYYRGVKGISIDGVLVPCPFCSLEVLLNKEGQIKCHHCETTYSNILEAIFLLDEEKKVKKVLLDGYAKEVLNKSTLWEKIKAIHATENSILKDMAINQLIDSIQETKNVTYDCPRCGEVDFLFFDEEINHLICINCEIIESKKCNQCKNNSVVDDFGADFCLFCRENPEAMHCECCHTNIYSNLNEVSIDVIKTDQFDLPLKYEGHPYIFARVCLDCEDSLRDFEDKGIIQMVPYSIKDK
ncbi:hypothetical protein [Pseudalkalibacillus hwajinpoensis]|uniref:hypothetical protein n=1 Tax=Guptibacillus hwajinpoensis TaxID=208199 RepID=UPI001CFD189D|nr:hypothetical protein [Pseudalkalibacillus hwajinpoensis]